MATESHSIHIDNHGNGDLTVFDPYQGAVDIREEDLGSYLQRYNDDRYAIDISHAGDPLPGSEYPADIHVRISR